MAPILSYMAFIASLSVALAVPAPAPEQEATKTVSFPGPPLGTGTHHHHHGGPPGEAPPFPIENRDEDAEHFPSPTSGFPFPTGGSPFPGSGQSRKHRHERRVEKGHPEQVGPHFHPSSGFPSPTGGSPFPTGGYPIKHDKREVHEDAQHHRRHFHPTGGFPAPTGGFFPHPPKEHRLKKRAEGGQDKFRPHHHKKGTPLPGAPLPTGGFFLPSSQQEVGENQQEKAFKPHHHPHSNSTGFPMIPSAVSSSELPAETKPFFVYE